MELLTKRAGKKMYECGERGCGESFTRKWSLSVHIQGRHVLPVTGSRKRYRCDERDCNATFTSPDGLHTHNLVHHAGERPFKCDYDGCDKSYRKDAYLKRHKMISHEKDTSTSQQVICEVDGCKKMYCNKYVLNQHLAACHTEQDANSSKKKSDVEKNHKCNEPGCDAAFNRPYRLQNHKMTVHGGERPYRCDYEDCDKTYTNESHLARHKSISHSVKEIDRTKEVLCTVAGCGRIFSNKYSLKKHVSTIHTMFPFACHNCDEKFKRKSQLHAHRVEIHDEEAPYKCEKCPKVFILYNLYNKHLKNHKTYQCDCEMKFDRWSKLLKHRKSECSVPRKEHKCVICEKTFPYAKALSQHALLIHIPDSQVQLLQCPYLNCNNSYKYKTSLKNHITTCHEKIFKYVSCPEKNCDEVLKSKKNLKQHLRIVHNGLPAKVRKPRKPRKDKGTSKKSMALILSGLEVSTVDNYENIIEEEMDEGRKDNEMGCPSDGGCRDKIKEVDSLMDSQETTLDVVKSLPLSNNMTNTELKNCHERNPSVIEASLESKLQVPERGRLLYNNDIINSSDNGKNCTKELAEGGKNGEIINDDNKVSGITQLGNNGNVLAVNVDKDGESPNSPIVKSFQSNIEKNVVDEKASSRDTAEKSNDDFKYVSCPKKNCDKVLQSKKNLKQHLRIVHSGLPAKVRNPKRPRKDKGKSKKSMALILSGLEVGAAENYEEGEMDKGRKEKALDEMESPSDGGCRDKIEEVDTLMYSQETTLDVVKSLPLSNNMTNTKLINCHERNPSVTEASLESKLQVPERGRLLYNNDTINSSDNVINGKNCTKELAEGEKNGEIINDDNEVSGITQLGNNGNVLAINVNKDEKSPNSPIVKSFQSDIEKNIVDEKASSRDTAEMSDDDLLNLTTDTSLLTSSQNSCDSGIILFDFPEFENIDGGDNLETVPNEVTVTQDVDRKDSYILDEEKLKKRLGVMCKDIFSVVRHLEHDTN